jgi:HAMP domain-containing protein
VLADYPAGVDDVRRIFEKLEIAHGIAVDLKKALKSGNAAEARRLVDFKFDPARDDVTFHMDRLINILGANTRSTEAEVAARSAWMLRTTIGILVGGTAAALIGAFLLTQFFVTRPLRLMAQAMTQMAGGHLAVPVEGDRRADEIGAMARAVAVFRNNALALRDTEHARSVERKLAEAEKAAALEAVAVAFEREPSPRRSRMRLPNLKRSRAACRQCSKSRIAMPARPLRRRKTPRRVRPMSPRQSKNCRRRSPTSARRSPRRPTSSKKRPAAPTARWPTPKRW